MTFRDVVGLLTYKYLYMSAAYFLTVSREDVRKRRQMTREHDPRYCLIKSKRVKVFHFISLLLKSRK